MKILELPQGHYHDLSGLALVDVLAMCASDDAEFLDRNPQCRPYHRPTCHEREAADQDTAPFGYEWYIADAQGILQRHSQHYDSSG